MPYRIHPKGKGLWRLKTGQNRGLLRTKTPTPGKAHTANRIIYPRKNRRRRSWSCHGMSSFVHDDEGSPKTEFTHGHKRGPRVVPEQPGNQERIPGPGQVKTRRLPSPAGRRPEGQCVPLHDIFLLVLLKKYHEGLAYRGSSVTLSVFPPRQGFCRDNLERQSEVNPSSFCVVIFLWRVRVLGFPPFSGASRKWQVASF